MAMWGQITEDNVIWAEKKREKWRKIKKEKEIILNC